MHNTETNLFFKSIFIGLIIVLIINISFFSYYTLNPGFAALHMRMSKIINVTTIPGMKFKIPFIDRIVYIDTRITKAHEETTALSRDLQTLRVGMVINYRITNPLEIYQEIGINFKKIIIDPFSQESVKAIIAQFTAEDLIQSRHIAKDKVVDNLRSRLKPLYINLVDFNFTHLDFSPDFIKAVEDKQIAEQSAKTAKNLTERVKEEGLQSRTRADAEAYALKVKRESITPELVSLKKVEAQMKAIEKWDGKLPLYTGDATPLISLPTA
ncbi:MAG: prohibitin family protein [Candidatus Dependentiae bacterium]